MKLSLFSTCVAVSLALAASASAGPTCGVRADKAATTKTTLVVNYNVSGCPTLSDPAGAKARICIEKEGTNNWTCNSLHRTNAPTVGTNTGNMRFIGLTAGTKYRAIGWYAKKVGDNIYWAQTNSVILRTRK